MDRDARLVDAHGQRHTRAAQGARIVSLVPSITELLFDMDLGAQVVGRTGFCIHPREALRSVPKLGGTKGRLVLLFSGASALALVLTGGGARGAQEEGAEDDNDEENDDEDEEILLVGLAIR